MRRRGGQTNPADSVGEAQRERLSFIDLHAFFCGEVRRPDLEARFGIKPAAATRDFLLYRTLAPHNLRYDTSAKTYVPVRRFRPVFGFEPDRVMSWLIQGFGDGLGGRIRRPIPGDAAGTLSTPPLDTLAVITRAIHQSKLLSIHYWSVSSGESERVIVPTALVDSGLRWHVRAWDRKRTRFADFVVTRITSPQMLDEVPGEHELPTSDHQWNRMVDLELVPHPGLRHPAAVSADYGLVDGVLRRQVRAAVAGYALHRWQVDCSPNHRLEPEAHHLWLRNTQTLYRVESAVMAPGYPSDGQAE